MTVIHPNYMTVSDWTRLDVPGRDWHPEDVDDDERKKLGEAIRAERIQRGWGKEEAARQAGISSITWKRAEDGLRIQDFKLSDIERALGWGHGSGTYVARGKPPIIEDTEPPKPGEARLFFRDDGRTDDELSEGWSWVFRFADLCRQRGADERFIEYLYDDAMILIDSVAREQRRRGVDLRTARHNYALAAREGDIQLSPSLGFQADAGEESQVDPDED